MDDIQRIDHFLETCRIVQERGLVKGAGGNVSFRLSGGRMLITPSGRSLTGLCIADALIRQPDETWKGTGKPSREWRMHQLCYAREDVQVVIHVHSPYAVAVSCMEGIDPVRGMPAYTPGYAIYAGTVPVLPYMVPGGDALAEAVGDALAAHDAVLLANHGVVAVGANVEHTLNILEEIEENAKVHCILGGRGRALDAAQLAELKTLYG